MLTRIATAFLILVIFLGGESNAFLTSTEAPSIRTFQAEAPVALGTWDDALVCKKEDFILVRRGDTLFSLPIGGSPRCVKLASSPQLTGTHMIIGARSGHNFWVFVNSRTAFPFGIEVYNGKIVDFDIPGLSLSKGKVPSIDSCVSTPQANAMLIETADGDPKTWPRDNNRPVFFWFSLMSGHLVQLPIGWDPNYFSADQMLSVFDKPEIKPDGHRVQQGVNMETGQSTTAIPEAARENFTPYDWEDEQDVKPVYVRHPELADDGAFLSGAAVRGSSVLIPAVAALNRVPPFSMTTAKVRDGLIGFRLRRSGSSLIEPAPFWLVPLHQGERAEHVRDDVVDFSLLNRSSSVFVTRSQSTIGPSGIFFHTYGTALLWSVLDGIEGLPKLSQEVEAKHLLEDRRTIQLIDSFGSGKQDALTGCLCQEFRSVVLRSDLIAVPRDVQQAVGTWRRLFIITSAGERAMTTLFREGSAPDEIWLHDSGFVISVRYSWKGIDASREREIELIENKLHLR